MNKNLSNHVLQTMNEHTQNVLMKPKLLLSDMIQKQLQSKEESPNTADFFLATLKVLEKIEEDIEEAVRIITTSEELNEEQVSEYLFVHSLLNQFKELALTMIVDMHGKYSFDELYEKDTDYHNIESFFSTMNLSKLAETKVSEGYYFLFGHGVNQEEDSSSVIPVYVDQETSYTRFIARMIHLFAVDMIESEEEYEQTFDLVGDNLAIYIMSEENAKKFESEHECSFEKWSELA